MKAVPAGPSPALLNARYVAIRTAEAKGLSRRLLQASRDKTPGVRRLVVPMLYHFWQDNREAGWTVLEQIARGSVRFPGIPDRDALETFGEISMPILNACRHDREQMARLAAIWRTQMDALYESPLAKAGRLFARRWVLKLGANALGEVLKRQPSYQPVNYRELQITFSRPDAFRAHWRTALECLERPEVGTQAIGQLLDRGDLPFDLYIMLISERALIYHGAKVAPAATIDLLEQLYRRGCRWFRQSVLYVLFHVLSNLPAVEEDWLDRYAVLTLDFYQSRSWDCETEGGRYNFLNVAANADIAAQARGRVPRTMPEMLEQAISSGDQEAIKGLFDAIDGTATNHGNPALALALLEHAYVCGKSAIEERVLRSLATVRLHDQPMVDAYIAQHRAFGRISSVHVAAVEPSLGEEDMVTLIDGFVIHMMLNADPFRAEICGAFRRALTADSVDAFLLQILQWVRDGLAVLPASKPA